MCLTLVEHVKISVLYLALDMNVLQLTVNSLCNFPIYQTNTEFLSYLTQSDVQKLSHLFQ